MKQSRLRLKVMAAVLGVLASSLVGAAPAQPGKVVKLGFAAVMSGPHAHYGKDMEYAAKIAVAEANAKKLRVGGQEVTFELVSEDDMADPKTGTAVAQRLIDAGVSAVIGHFNSGTSIPASRIYHTAGIPQVSPAATNPGLTQQGYKSVFRVINTDAQMGNYAGKYAVTGLGLKRIAIVDDRTAFGKGMADEFEKSVRQAQGNVVAREFTTDRASDFSAILTKLKSLDADLVFFGGLDAQAGPMARQMSQLKMAARLMGGGGFTNQSFIDTATAAAEGAMSWEYGAPLASMPGGKVLAAKMKSKFNVETSNFSAFTYDAVWVVVNAMVKADSALPERYLPALAATDYEGVTGRIRFDGRGDVIDPSATLFEVRKQAWMPLRTVKGM